VFITYQVTYQVEVLPEVSTQPLEVLRLKPVANPSVNCYMSIICQERLKRVRWIRTNQDVFQWIPFQFQYYNV